MARKGIYRHAALGVGLIAVTLILDGFLPINIAIQDAEARLGRPATPASVAGVSRRTTRRVIRRSSVYVASLPAACSTVVIEGTTLHSCGGTYYQASGSQYVVVYVD